MSDGGFKPDGDTLGSRVGCLVVLPIFVWGLAVAEDLEHTASWGKLTGDRHANMLLWMALWLAVWLALKLLLDRVLRRR